MTRQRAARVLTSVARASRPCILPIAAILMVFASPAPAIAHPLSQGALDVVIRPDKVIVRARVTVEEVTVTNSATGSNPLPGPWAAAGTTAYEQHADYLAKHLHLSADGTPLTASV